MKEYMITSIREQGVKVSSVPVYTRTSSPLSRGQVLTQLRPKGALIQNACLNFCTLFSNESRIASIKNFKIHTGGI